MGFVIKKVSDYGVDNPIVARTMIQAKEVVQFLRLDKEKRDRVLGIYMKCIQPRLLRCMEIANALEKEIDKIKAELGVAAASAQTVHSATILPQVTKLDEYVESYLYNAKSALRDLALIFEPIFGKKFSGSRYDEIKKWAEEIHGKGSPLAEFLAEDQPWIKRIVDMRNAVEHPESKTGPLNVSNFEVFEDRDSKRRVFREPVWFMNGERPSSIVSDMKTMLHNLLGFSENILVVAYVQSNPGSAIQFAEIPESDRDPKCPVRLRAVLDETKIKT